MLDTPNDPSAARDRLCWPDANEQKTPGLVCHIHKLWTLKSGSADALMPKPELGGEVGLVSNSQKWQLK